VAQSWIGFPDEVYVGLFPWTWVEFESSDPPGPFPFLGGVDPAVVASLYQVHQHLSGAIDIAISDVFAGRASVKDPALQRRLENAYIEVVHSRPHLREHIRCGRDADGAFYWEFPLDPSKSAVVRYVTLRVCNTRSRRAVPLGLDRELAPAVGRFIGSLDGTRRAAEIRAEIQRLGMAFGAGLAGYLGQFLDLLITHDCIAVSPRSSVREQWLRVTRDRDIVHLGHAALMYRRKADFFLFDPWLMPWFAEAPLPSPWTSLLPRPAVIFLTHDHDDHVDPRTLLAFPKETPVIVPSRKNRRALYYDYKALLGGLGFTQIIELAHGETWPFDTAQGAPVEGRGGVVAVPFYGECSCELGMPRNCYLIADRGRNIFIPVDSGPTNSGENAVKDGVVDELVRRYGPIDTIYAQPGQLLELRTFAAYACLSHPGRWLEVGENCCVTSEYLAQLAASARARLFVTYANGGADWLPDHPVFTFSGRNQALREMITAHWWPLEELEQKLALQGCRCHHSRALDIVRQKPDGTTEVLPGAAPSPEQLYRLDHGDPPWSAHS
jgi:L-ascorbate metabolism protein UlaG (beta-lactamase superfamily)